MRQGKKRTRIDADQNPPVRRYCQHDILNAVEDCGLMLCPDCGEDVTLEYWILSEETDRNFRKQLVEVLEDHEQY